MFRGWFLGLLMVVSIPPAVAQDKLTPKTVGSVVREVNRTIEKNYVFPEKVKGMTAKLSQGLSSGRYSVSSPARLAELMTQDMQAASKDGHMFITFDPAEAKARRESPTFGDRPDLEHFRKQMADSNHGITELKILPGNVRYMNISHWPWDPERSPQVQDHAMRFLRGGDAYIIDVRNSGGGANAAVTYLTSHFMDPGRKLMIFRSGPTKATETFSVKVNEGKLPQRPLFMLIGPASASAPEGAAAHVKHFNLGTLVGAKTAGAGNSNDLFPIEPGFVLSVSTGAGIHPVTNSSWEGMGIEPDIAVSAPAALDRAHLEALKSLQQSDDPAKAAQRAWLITALQAKLDPPALAVETVRDLPGRYRGPRMISASNGKLFYRRTDGSEVPLIPLGGELFAQGAPTAAYRIQFHRKEGVVTGATILTAAGPEEEIAREGN